MQFNIQNPTFKISINDPSFQPDTSPGCHLSLDISLDKFAFAALNIKNAKYLLLEVYSLEEIKNDQQLLNEIKKIVESSQIFKQSWKSASATVSSSMATLIPVPLFEESRAANAYTFNTGESGDPVVSDFLNTIDAYSLYTVGEEMRNYLNALFPGIKIMHLSSVLIGSIMIQRQRGESKAVFLNYRPSHFDILVAEGKQLLFYNSFNHHAAEDVVYYLLLVFEQLSLSQEHTPLTLLGELPANDELVALLKKYIASVNFGKRIENFNYSDLFNELPAHFYNTLFGQYLCV